MRVLVTNITLATRTGTETHTRDLAVSLRQRGDDVCVFTFNASGPLVPELRAAGVAVVEDARLCPFGPEVIHGHHNIALLSAMEAHPGAPALFVCHDATAWYDRAPRSRGIGLQAAVDELCRLRVAKDLGVPLEQVAVVGNAVDLDKFRPRETWAAKPRRALLFSSYAAEDTFLRPVREACAAAGIELEVAGSRAGKLSNTPETLLPEFDLVFAKARCAMEALCCGCAVALCGMEGVGPLVTPENFHELRRWNFGRRTLDRPHAVPALLEAVSAYDATAVAATSRLAREHLGLDTFADTWRGHHARLAAAGGAPPQDSWAGAFRGWVEAFDGWSHAAGDPEEIQRLQAALAQAQQALRDHAEKGPFGLRQLVRHPRRFFQEMVGDTGKK